MNNKSLKLCTLLVIFAGAALFAQRPAAPEASAVPGISSGPSFGSSEAPAPTRTRSIVTQDEISKGPASTQVEIRGPFKPKNQEEKKHAIKKVKELVSKSVFNRPESALTGFDVIIMERAVSDVETFAMHLLEADLLNLTDKIKNKADLTSWIESQRDKILRFRMANPDAPMAKSAVATNGSERIGRSIR